MIYHQVRYNPFCLQKGLFIYHAGSPSFKYVEKNTQL